MLYSTRLKFLAVSERFVSKRNQYVKVLSGIIPHYLGDTRSFDSEQHSRSRPGGCHVVQGARLIISATITGPRRATPSPVEGRLVFSPVNANPPGSSWDGPLPALESSASFGIRRCGGPAGCKDPPGEEGGGGEGGRQGNGHFCWEG